MSKTHIAVKYRIYPDTEQIAFFQKTFGCCRFVYNMMLTIQKELYDRNKLHLNKYDSFTFMTSELKSRFSFLKEADSLALMNSCFDLDDAYSRFFKGEAGFPKFKSRKHSRLSYTTNNQNGTVSISERHIKLPKAGKIRAKIHRNIDNAVLKSATVSQDRNGKYYCSVLFEYESAVNGKPVLSKSDATGLDFNEKTLYVDNNGSIPSISDTSHTLKSLGHKQRKLSHMIESHIIGYKIVGKKRFPIFDKPLYECKNIQKQRKLISKIHNKVSNQRTDFLHKESNQITNDYSLICIEDLSIKSMMSNKSKEHSALKRHNINRSALDNGWYMFTSILSYKADMKGCHVVKVPKMFPSSQMCSCCGHINPMVKDLTIREWICPDCKTSHDRDINAAINILNKGYEMYTNQ